MPCLWWCLTHAFYASYASSDASPLCVLCPLLGLACTNLTKRTRQSLSLSLTEDTQNGFPGFRESAFRESAQLRLNGVLLRLKNFMLRYLYLGIIAVCAMPAPAQTTSPFTIVSAASYQASVSPGSLAAIFGSSLSFATESAQLDASGQLPTQLGGTSIQIDGRAAPLVYVSPRQINLVVPAETQPGTANIVISSNGNRLQGTADVRRTVPGMFSSNGSGKGAGAVLNAVTYEREPFLVETLENSGDDKRTRLSLFATGIRFAENPTQDPSITDVASKVRVQGRTASGKAVDLPVEYAGAAPGFFGLDQVNVAVPPDADGLGVVSLTLTVENQISNTVTLTMGQMPAGRLALAGLDLSQSTVAGGATVSGSVLLNAPAPASGVAIQLKSSNASVATVPMFVTVPAGQVAIPVSIQTSSPASVQDVTITASAGARTRAAALRVRPSDHPSILSVTLSPVSVAGGAAISGTVTLSGSAPMGGVVVALSSNNGAVQVPATITVLFGQTMANFTATAISTPDAQNVTITASFEDSSKTATVALVPALLLTLSTDNTVGGTDVTGTVTLGNPAPAGGALVTLQPSDFNVGRVPPFVTVPGGQVSGTFTVQTTAAASNRTLSITATYNGVSQSASLTVSSGQVVSIGNLVVSPTVVKGGTSATGTVTFTNPAGLTGAIVSLASDNLLAASVPAFVSVPAGQTSAQFNIRTSAVGSVQTVKITASSGSSSKTATLTVN